MLIPITPESEWTEFLSPLPLSSGPTEHTLVILSPHPDDETLGCGGLIQQHVAAGGQIIVIAATDGDFAYHGGDALAILRRAEQQRALARLGVESKHLHRLGLPDGFVADHEDELYEKLLPFLTPGCRLFTPGLHDYHPDHEACARAAVKAAATAGVPLSFYFFWTWHKGTPQDLEALPVKRLPLTQHQQAGKEAALQCHTSQVYRLDGDPILPELLLAPSRRPYEVFLDA